MPRKLSQKNECEKFNNLVIRASAGTGKTFQLTNRYLRLLHQGVPPDRILATTFTRKAAGEILDRVITRLAESVFDEKRREQLAAHVGAPRLSREECLKLLQSLLTDLHRLRIGTLDSLFSQLAHAFSLEIGLPWGWKILELAQEIALRDLAVDNLLRREQVSHLVELTHLLSKGGAARGVANLIRDTVSVLHGLFQETDESGWNTIPKSQQMDPAEWESLLNELRGLKLSSKRHCTARDEDCLRASAGDWESFIEKGLAAKILSQESTYYSQPIPAEAVALYRRIFDQVRSVLVTRLSWQTQSSFELLRGFDIERRHLQTQHRGVRFDDVTHALDRALRRDNAEKRDLDLAHRLDGQVAHLLIDEFQDTAPRQWRAIQPLVEPVRQRNKASSLFCVGDVKQAIYGWRGGVAEIFDAVVKQIPEVQTERLTQSFRSSPAVIEFVNRTFQGLSNHPRLDRAAAAVNAWQAEFEPHSTVKSNLSGYACLRTAPLPKEGQKAPDAVLEYAADVIGELHREAPGCELGVLVMTNAVVGRLAYELRQRQLTASEEGGNPLIDSAAVQAIMSLLRLSDHPGDLVARFHVASTPLASEYGLEKYDDDALAHRVAAEVRRELLAKGYGLTIQRMASVVSSHCGPRDAARLEQLVEQAYGFEGSATLRADDFLSQLETSRVAEPTRSAIRIMTVHQAKGLEFDIVVLPHLDVDILGQPPPFVVERPNPVDPVTAVCRYVNAATQKLLPDRLQKMFAAATDREVAESLCVMYVAMTRAIHAVHAIIAPSLSERETMPRTYAGLIRSALVGTDPVKPTSTLLECGDREWFRSVSAAAGGPQAATQKLPPPARIQLAPAAERRRGMERVSPSSLEGGSRVRMDKWLELRALDREGDDAAVRGSVIHAWLEQVKWLDDGVPDDLVMGEIAARVARELGAKARTAEWLAEFHRFVKDPVMASQLKRAAYQHPRQLGFAAEVVPLMTGSGVVIDVDNERHFAVRDAGGMLSGSIDRLILVRKGDRFVAADIVDFKTDILPPDNPQAISTRVEFYRPQMEAYRRAVAKMLDIPRPHVAARLLFVSMRTVAMVNEREATSHD